MTVYLTRGGVLVYGGLEWRRVKERRGPWGWKVPCWRTATGGWHGWLWLHSLTELDP